VSFSVRGVWLFLGPAGGSVFLCGCPWKSSCPPLPSRYRGVCKGLSIIRLPSLPRLVRHRGALHGHPATLSSLCSSPNRLSEGVTMLDLIHNRPLERNCDGSTRRDFLKIGTLTLGTSFTLPHLLPPP